MQRHEAILASLSLLSYITTFCLVICLYFHIKVLHPFPTSLNPDANLHITPVNPIHQSNTISQSNELSQPCHHHLTYPPLSTHLRHRLTAKQRVRQRRQQRLRILRLLKHSMAPPLKCSGLQLPLPVHASHLSLLETVHGVSDDLRVLLRETHSVAGAGDGGEVEVCGLQGVTVR